MSWQRDKSTIVLAVLSLGLAFLLVLRQTGRLGPLQDALVSMIVPVQYTVSRAFNNLGGKFEALVRMQELEERNKELQETLDLVALRTVELEEAKIELEILREQLGFKQANPQYEMLSAEVIGEDPSNLVRFLIIDRGARDGIKLGMPVISSQGLVGRISQVGSDWSKILLLSDPSSSVNAMIQRSRATGTVQGRTGRRLVMRYISPEESLEVGDIVITSGLGGNLPRHLVIGQVTAVRKSDVEMFQEAEIRSAMDFRRLEIVMVILNFQPIDIGNE